MGDRLLPGRLSLPTRSQRIAILFIVIAPFVLNLFAPLLWYGSWVSSADLIQLFVWYIVTVQAVTVSFHRELTHRSLTLKPVARYTQAILASFSVEGKLTDWCARHRMHHEFSDTEEDPHSPHGFGHGVMAVIKGFFHSHVGWLFKEGKPDYNRYIPDLLKDRGLMLIDKLFPLWAVLSFLLPGLIGLIFSWSVKGFFLGVFWGGFVRVFLVHHITWSINSVCHLWGTKPFRSDDESVNNPVFGILGGGEGWHKNHHAFPWSARIGLRFWEVDLGWYVIRLLNFFGLVEKLRVPNESQILLKKV